MQRRLTDTTSLVTALPMFANLGLPEADQFVVGGHDIRRSNFWESAQELHRRAGVFDRTVLLACEPDLEAWTENVRPGTVCHAGPAISRLADLPEAQHADTPRHLIDRIQGDLRAFQTKHQLDQVVVINVASTEAPCPLQDIHQSAARFAAALNQRQTVVPPSVLYAWATLDLGWPYINFTPSLGASFPAAVELASERKTVCGGQDGKTGETLLKSVLAPMFALRNWQILSWVGHNIFGNRDGQVLDDPTNKASKILTKDQVITQILGYKPQTHVSIEYLESLDDWKTAWDHIHFRGFLGTKMIMQFIWQGCDSLLAGPLVIDLARLALLSQRRGEVGVLGHLACFFKNPQGVEDHDFFKQFAMLADYAGRTGAKV